MTTSEEEKPRPVSAPYDRPYVALSKKEVDTLRLVARNLTRAQIAKELGHNPETVRSRFHTMYRKTGIRNASSLVAWGYQHGYILLPKERAPLDALRRRVKWLEKELQTSRAEAAKLNAQCASLAAEVRAATAQLQSVPWQTTRRARV